jgi:GxxExxY protein
VEENRLGEIILGCALKVHKALGPGLLESTYEACLAHEIGKLGVAFERQRTLPLVYDSLTIEAAYRLDLLVGNLVVVGYLLNFNVAMMRDGSHRMANGL